VNKLVVGDFDGDGDQDLFEVRISRATPTTCNGQSITAPPEHIIYRTDSPGQLTAVGLPSLTGRARSIGVADVDLDGDLDVVVGTWETANELHIFTHCFGSDRLDARFGTTQACTSTPLYTRLSDVSDQATHCPLHFVRSAVPQICQRCAPGFQRRLDQISCSACSKGSAQMNATGCEICPRGTYSDILGSVRCSLCSIGEFSSQRAASACTACPAGKFSERPGASSCTSCPRGGFCMIEGAVSASMTFQMCSTGTFNPRLGASNSSACIPCSAGKANPVPGSTSRSACIDCIPGSIAANHGTDVCQMCPAGTWQGGPGATACHSCAPGRYCVEGASTPIPCAGGTRSNASLAVMTSQSDCISCRTGTFCPVGSANATPCAPGTVNALERQESCVRCELGTYQDAAGASSCQSCAPGHWCTASDQVPCGANKWNNESGSYDQQDCRLCPPFSSTLRTQNASNRAQCQCDTGYFDNSLLTTVTQPDCQQCTVGTSCPEAGTTIEQMPLSRGYWRPSATSLDVRRCPDAAENCNSAVCDDSSSGCRGGVDISSYCAPTLDGPLCRLCENVAARVYYVAANGEEAAKCEACGSLVSESVGVAFGIATGLVLALLLLRVLACKCLSYFGTLQRYREATKPETKLKIIAGFCARIDAHATILCVPLPQCMTHSALAMRRHARHQGRLRIRRGVAVRRQTLPQVH
jgi:hypothetical protein